jgi:hypothetical protein
MVRQLCNGLLHNLPSTNRILPLRPVPQLWMPLCPTVKTPRCCAADAR